MWHAALCVVFYSLVYHGISMWFIYCSKLISVRLSVSSEISLRWHFYPPRSRSVVLTFISSNSFLCQTYCDFWSWKKARGLLKLWLISYMTLNDTYLENPTGLAFSHMSMRFILSLRSPLRELEVGYSGSGVPFGVMYILPPPRITLKGHQTE